METQGGEAMNRKKRRWLYGWFFLLSVTILAPPSAAQTSTLVMFDNPAPPGSPDSLLNGIFQGIDFGTGRWRWSGPYGADSTNNVYFDSST